MAPPHWASGESGECCFRGDDDDDEEEEDDDEGERVVGVVVLQGDDSEFEQGESVGAVVLTMNWKK